MIIDSDGNEKKKILCLRSTQSPICIDKYNIQQIGMGKAFVKKGFNFDFVTFNKNKQKRIMQFAAVNGCIGRIIELPRLRLFSWGINFEILKQEFLDQYDIVILQEYYQIMTYLVSRKIRNAVLYSGPYWNLFQVPVASVFYDLFLSKAINNRIKIKYTKSFLAKIFLEKKGYTGVECLGVALDTERFDHTVELTNKTKKLVDFMTNNECILYIGSIDSNKNTSFLLDVFSELINQRPNLKLVIIGKGAVSFWKRLIGIRNDSYPKELFSKYPRRIMMDVYYLDEIDNAQLKFIYPLAKAFLLPSKKEIFGMVMLEAMYFGTPVVSSLNGGSATLIKSEEYGQLIPEFNTKKWVNAVIHYIDDPEFSSKVAETAKKQINEIFTWEILVDRIIEDTGLE